MNRLRTRLLEFAPVLLLLLVGTIFTWQTPKFLEPRNLTNIVVQSASTGIVAVGMTFVLISAGVDLSVGAIMFVAAALAGKASLAWNLPWPVGLGMMLLVGLVFGAANALFIIKARVVAFIVTLAGLFIGRGLGLWITQTRAMNLGNDYLQIGTTTLLGVPFPAWLFLAVLVLAHVVLTRTPFGRQLFALGYNVEAARKAGIPTERLLVSVYLISGVCAALAAMVSLGQLGAVSPKFGEGKEFAAIAAAVLGGTSLFGGRGSVLPGTLLGTVLIQTIENGLVVTNANPYLYPMVTSGIIFLAVLLESFRNRSTLTLSA